MADCKHINYKIQGLGMEQFAGFMTGYTTLCTDCNVYGEITFVLWSKGDQSGD